MFDVDMMLSHLILGPVPSQLFVYLVHLETFMSAYLTLLQEQNSLLIYYCLHRWGQHAPSTTANIQHQPKNQLHVLQFLDSALTAFDGSDYFNFQILFSGYCQMCLLSQKNFFSWDTFNIIFKFIQITFKILWCKQHCGKSSISGFRDTSDNIQREVFENQDNHYHQMQSMQSMKIGALVIDSWFDAGNWLWYFGLVDPRGGKNVELGNLVPGKWSVLRGKSLKKL